MVNGLPSFYTSENYCGNYNLQKTIKQRNSIEISIHISLNPPVVVATPKN